MPTNIPVHPELKDFLDDYFGEDAAGVRYIPLEVYYEPRICGTCSGEGTTWHGWGYGTESCSYSSDEWAELGEEGQDAYMDGTMDKECPECKGAKILRMLDEVSTPSSIVRDWQEWMKDKAEMHAEMAAERRAGA